MEPGGTSDTDAGMKTVPETTSSSTAGSEAVAEGKAVTDGDTVLSPFLTGRNVCSPNILRTLRRTMIRFLIKLLVRRRWFGQS